MESLDATTELCFPQLHNISCKKPQPTRSDVLPSYNLLFCLSLLTVIMNLLVIISIAHFRQLHSPTNLLILSLAVSDFLVGFVVVPLKLLTEACWLLGNILCPLYFVLNYIIASSSIGNVVLISIDRYLAICDPLHYYTKVTMDRTKLCVCFCWLCTLMYNGLILNDFLRDPTSHSSCYGECVLVLNEITGAVDLVCTFIGPITVIVVLYVRVFMVAVSQARAMRLHVATVTLQQKVTMTAKKSEVKAAGTLGVVVIVFIASFCPYYIMSGEGIDESSFSAPFVTWLWLINSSVNPVIYAFFYPWFRKSIKLILTMQILQPRSSHVKIL